MTAPALRPPKRSRLRRRRPGHPRQRQEPAGHPPTGQEPAAGHRRRPVGVCRPDRLTRRERPLPAAAGRRRRPCRRAAQPIQPAARLPAPLPPNQAALPRTRRVRSASTATPAGLSLTPTRVGCLVGMELGWQLAPLASGRPERRNVIDHSGQQRPVGRVGRGDRDRQGQAGGIGQQVQLGPWLAAVDRIGTNMVPHGGPARPWCPHHPSGATRRLESRAAGGMRHGPTATATSTSAWRRGSGSCRRNDRFSTPSLLATGRHEPGADRPGSGLVDRSTIACFPPWREVVRTDAIGLPPGSCTCRALGRGRPGLRRTGAGETNGAWLLMPAPSTQPSWTTSPDEVPGVHNYSPAS